MWLLPVLSAFAAIAGATPKLTCPWGGRCEDDESSFLNLLQVHAEKDIDGSSLLGRFRRGQHAAIKRTHPFYHTTKELKQQVHHLSKNCGGAMTVETHSDNRTDIDLIKLRAPKSAPVNRVFILFGEHSRELISPESGLRLLEVLCGKTHVDSDVSIPDVLKDSEFQIILNGNPHSRNLVENGDYCLRTNPNGVDLNRNWDEKWVEDEAYGGSDTNPGPRPFSEPETRIFKKLVEEFKPTTFLTVHSGTRGMYMPWAYDMKHLAKYNAPLMLDVLKQLDQKHCKCPFGAAGKEVGYPCPGTCLDWVYSKLQSPYVFAFEIYTSPDRDTELKQRWNDKMNSGGLKLLQTGNHLGHEHFANFFADFVSDFVQRSTDEKSIQMAYDDCFDMFNPKTEELYNATVDNWAVAYVEMAAKIAKDIKGGMVGKNVTSALNEHDEPVDWLEVAEG